MSADYLPHFALPAFDLRGIRASLLQLELSASDHEYRTALPFERWPPPARVAITEPRSRFFHLNEHRRKVRARAVAWLLRARGIES